MDKVGNTLRILEMSLEADHRGLARDQLEYRLRTSRSYVRHALDALAAFEDALRFRLSADDVVSTDLVERLIREHLDPEF